MKIIFLILTLVIRVSSTGQNISEVKSIQKKKLKYIEPKFHVGSFIKSDNKIGNSGILDNGYKEITVKLGWQPTNPYGWQSRYGYPSYGVGYYVGFLSDAEVFGSPNAIYGFIKFPISNPDRRNEFSIEPSLGLAHKFNPYHSETNPVNTAIGTRATVYFNLDFGFSYKWTREFDLLYGFDFSHFSNGAVYQPNSGLNLYGLNVGLRYNYNAERSRKKSGLYTVDALPARFKRPPGFPEKSKKGNAITFYLAGGVAQNDSLIDSDVILGTFTGVIDYEYQFSEKHVATGGIDVFYDSRLQDREIPDRWLSGIHIGYDFRFYRFAVKMQVGVYPGNSKGKGGYFLRPAVRYSFSKKVFAQWV